jgi:hypothetical protein
MDFEKRRAELAERIVAAQRQRRRGKVYPAELRRDIESFVRDRRAATGRSLHGTAPDLGLSQTTLVRWKLQARRDPGLPHMRPVSVLPMPPTFTGAISVSGPRGLRIEGLDFDAVVELFRRLA